MERDQRIQWTICKRFEFSASHQLAYLPEGHPCGRLHGHNYVVEVELSADTLNAEHFVMDFGELAPFRRYLDDTFDHRHLNDILHSPQGERTTCEQVAAHLLRWLVPQYPEVVAVRVSETPKTWGEARLS